MTIQEQEHLDYEMGAASEYSNAHAVSRMRHQEEANDQIAAGLAAVANGKFIVITEAPAYCHMTDAIIGSWRHLDSIHDTREAATERLFEVGADMNPDENAYILPAAPRQPQAKPYVALTDDEIPF